MFYDRTQALSGHSVYVTGTEPVSEYHRLWLNLHCPTNHERRADDQAMCDWMHEGRLAALERAERKAVEAFRAEETNHGTFGGPLANGPWRPDAILSLRRLVVLDFISEHVVCVE